ncbi:MAG: hypothetical protein NTV39_04100 [Candidatus Saccharibacteria bacterium]|nr:hypothetical protein [Candidatus Saccharibacteria bacterium]
MALPRSKHPTALLCGIVALGICLFILAKMPEAHMYGVIPYLSKFIKVMWLLAAIFSFCFGYGIGNMFDRKASR